MSTKTPKPEKEETPKDEMEETPEVQKKEAEEGTEEHGSVAIPEAFQIQATALVDSCESKACLSFLRNLVSDKEDEMRKSEMDEVPQELSTEGMPKG